MHAELMGSEFRRDRGSRMTSKHRKPHNTFNESQRQDLMAKTHVASDRLSDSSALIEPYRQELYLHCYRLLGSWHDAEDLVQETMLRAWQRFDTFKGASSLRTWLYAIATHACLDALKKRPPRVLPMAAYPAADPTAALAAPN